MPRVDAKKKEYKLKDFKGWVQMQMKLNHMTQAEVGKALGLSQPSVSDMLRIPNPKKKDEKVNPDPFSYGQVLTLCELFGIDGEEKQRLWKTVGMERVWTARDLCIWYLTRKNRLCEQKNGMLCKMGSRKARDDMGREILYRGKRIDNGEWVEGFYTQLPKTSLGATIIANGDLCAEDVADYIIVNTIKQHSNFSNGFPLEVVGCERYEVDPDTIGQYTGLTDKNGRKIFEGDIVECVYDGSMHVHVIVWDESELDFKGTNGKENYGSDYDYLLCCEELVVIGNIFDNPELLGGAE